MLANNLLGGSLLLLWGSVNTEDAEETTATRLILHHFWSCCLCARLALEVRFRLPHPPTITVNQVGQRQEYSRLTVVLHDVHTICVTKNCNLSKWILS